LFLAIHGTYKKEIYGFYSAATEMLAALEMDGFKGLLVTRVALADSGNPGLDASKPLVLSECALRAV